MAFAQKSRACEDLLFSCPVAAFAIATGYRGKQVTSQATRLVQGGMRIDLVMGALCLPAWMRQLPPEALKKALPAALPGQRSGSDFGRHIGNFMPSSHSHLRTWLQWVLEGHLGCDEAFALWLASTPATRGRVLPLKHLALVAAYAWFSKRRQLDAGKLIVRPWSRRMSFHRAMFEARNWLIGLLMDICIDHQARYAHWARTEFVEGIEFVPLNSAESLLQEGRAMSNCIARYTEHVLYGKCLLYSLRRAGSHCANMQVCFSHESSRSGSIVQMCGPGNKQPPMHVQRAGEVWLDWQHRFDTQVTPSIDKLPIDQELWAYIWEPYWAANGRRGILTTEPSSADLATVLLSYKMAGRTRTSIR